MIQYIWGRKKLKGDCFSSFFSIEGLQLQMSSKVISVLLKASKSTQPRESLRTQRKEQGAHGKCSMTSTGVRANIVHVGGSTS
jgi:hypothetical protein